MTSDACACRTAMAGTVMWRGKATTSRTVGLRLPDHCEVEEATHTPGAHWAFCTVEILMETPLRINWLWN